MSFALTPPTYEDNPRLQSLVERLRDYLDGELAEYEAELGLTQESHYIRETLEPVWRRSRELGFYGIHLPPTELGGQNLTYTELAALKEEVGASPRVLATSVLGDMGGPLRAGSIFQYATEHQLEKYLIPVLRGEKACCFSLTENDAGSDVRGMLTTATPGRCRMAPERPQGVLVRGPLRRLFGPDRKDGIRRRRTGFVLGLPGRLGFSWLHSGGR